MDVRVRRHDQSRVAPYEFRDAAELFARQYGGHGDIVWVAAPVNCWQVRFTLKPGDPRLRHPDEQQDQPRPRWEARGADGIASASGGICRRIIWRFHSFTSEAVQEDGQGDQGG